MPDNLPFQLTSFIGRERDLAATLQALAAARLATLIGPGGIGKTRLALEAARQAAEDYPDGVWLVDLSALADPDLVPQAVAAVLGVREEPGRPLPETLAAFLRRRELLLVLDNCEHLIARCAQLVDALLRQTPGLRILATSRESLGVAGEVLLPVPPLELPAAAHPTDLAALQRSAAVRLFLERAAATAPGFTIASQNAAALVELCSRLDGIPLAIELAAARLRLLTLEQIAARLGDRFHLLTGGSRAALPRHQTLRGTLDWSYDLLTPAEQRFFRGLGVFAGGWTLEAAEAVCAGGEGAAADTLDLLGRLVDRSLVVAETSRTGAARYRLLETIRHYAVERLQECGEWDAASERQVAFYLRFVEEAEVHIRGPEQRSWLDALEAELDNLRAALRWLAGQTESPAVEARLRLAAAPWFFWFLRGHLSEGLHWAEEALAAAGPDISPAARAKGLYAAGFLASAPPPLQQALEIYRQLGDHAWTGRAALGLGVVTELAGETAPARLLFQEAIENGRRAGEPWTEAWAFSFLAANSYHNGDLAGARSLQEEGLRLWRGLGDRQGLAYALHGLGDITLALGERRRARVLYEESLAHCQEVGDLPNVATTLASLAQTALDGGDPVEAQRLFLQSLHLAAGAQLSDLVTNRPALPRCLAGLALLALQQGRRQQGVHLAAAAQQRSQSRSARRDVLHGRLTSALAEARQVLGAESYQAAWEQGLTLSLDQALELLPLPEPPPAAPSQPALPVEPGLLTPREQEVLTLVAAGLTNRQIAEHLVVSVRTVEGHVASMLSKFGLSSRVQLAIRAAQQRP